MNKVNFSIILMLTLCFSCDMKIDVRSVYLKSNETIAHTIVVKMQNKNLRSVTVPRFESIDGENKKVGEFLADRLTADITNAPNSSVNLINREKMDEILDEHKLREAGVLNKNTVIEKGNMLGIDAIVIGKYKITKNIWGTPTNLSITYELVGIEKGVTMYANTLNLPKNQFPEVVPYCQ